MANIRGLTFSLGVDNSQLRRGLNQATAANNRYAMRTRNTFNNLGRFISGAAILGGLRNVISTTEMFDSALRSVQAVTGATGDNFERLADQSRNLGATTQFTATQAAEAQAFLGRAGFETNEILSATPGLLALASAGQLDLGRAADIASNVVQGFNLNAAETGRVADIMAAAAANSNTNVEQLGGAMSFAAPVAQMLGVSIEDATAAIGILSDAGVQGERAGTGLRRILLALTAPTSQAADVMEELGIMTRDTQGNFVGLPSIIGQFQTAIMNGSASVEDLNTIFGRQGIGAFNILVERGATGLSTFSGMLMNSAGAAQMQADTLNSGPRGAFRSLSSAIESVSLALGESGVIELIAQFARNFADIARAVGRFINQEPVLGRALVAIGAAMSLLLIAGGPITLFAAAIAGIVAFWPEIRAGAQAALDTVRSAFNRVLAPVRAFIARIRQIAIDLGLIDDPAEAFQNRINDTIRDVNQFSVNILRNSQAARMQIEDTFRSLGQGAITVEQATSMINRLMEGMNFTSSRSAETFRDNVLAALNEMAQEAVLGSIIPDMVNAIQMHMNRLPQIAAMAGGGFRDAFLERLRETGNTTATLSVQIGDAAAGSIRGFSDSIAELVTTGMANFAQFAQQLIRQLIAITVQALITQAILLAIGAPVGGGGFSSSLFGLGGSLAGVRQRGGPVSSGRTYLVGEDGPELFTPRSSGNVISNDDLMESNRGNVIENANVTVRVGPGASPAEVSDSINRGFADMMNNGAIDIGGTPPFRTRRAV